MAVDEERLEAAARNSASEKGEQTDCSAAKARGSAELRGSLWLCYAEPLASIKPRKTLSHHHILAKLDELAAKQKYKKNLFLLGQGLTFWDFRHLFTTETYWDTDLLMLMSMNLRTFSILLNLDPIIS